MEEIIKILDQFSLVEWILGSALLLCFLIQLFYYLFFYYRPYKFQKKKKTVTIPDEALPPISVIITSKDNAVMLEKNLPFIMEQEYPNFEVIVVNSGSTDDTDMVLKAAEQKYTRLYHTFVPARPNNINEKKLALTLGIKAAKNDCLLFTEAYCRPCSDQWIKEYGKEFSQGKEIILGFCRLEIPKKTVLRGFMNFDNLIHHLKFLSMAILKKPFIGINRNLAYKKELFFINKGYSSILDIESGEDGIFINKVAAKRKTGVLLSRESLTETNQANPFSIFREKSTSKQTYKGFHFLLFSFETFSKYCFYILLAGIIILDIMTVNFYLIAFALLLFLIRYAFQWRIIRLSSRLFNAGKYHINLLFYDIFQPLYNALCRKKTTRKYRG